MIITRELRRLHNLTARAAVEATALGHNLAGFEIEDGWQSAVTTCRTCDRLAAVDWTEGPYLFGHAYRARCGKRIGGAVQIDIAEGKGNTMTPERITELRAALAAENISYGELGEIEDAFATIPDENLRDVRENAMASDMLDEIEANR